MINAKARLLILIFLTVVGAGCDRYTAIAISNKTAEKVRVLVKTTSNFQTEKQKVETTTDGFDIYELTPNEYMQVGIAIAEIDDDLPFTSIKIVRAGDTVSANNVNEIKALFDKSKVGGLKKPYNLVIE